MKQKYSSAVWLFVVAAALCLAAALVQWRVWEPFGARGGETLLRIAHYQLEPGYREALRAIAMDFEEIQRRRGNRVRVEAVPVPSRYYETWLNTQLAAGTAPDIVQQPASRIQYRADYYERHFLPLDEILERPNPFNDFDKLTGEAGDLDLHRNLVAIFGAVPQGLPHKFTLRESLSGISPATLDFLKKAPLRETYLDRMQGSYHYESARYFAFTTVTLNTRLFYNKTLLKKATGSDAPPASLGEFFKACQAIRKMETKEGLPIVPIAALGTTPDDFFEHFYMSPFTYGLCEKLDRDMSGSLSPQEIYGAIQKGELSLDEPCVREFFECSRALGDVCTDGYLAAGEDQANFAFIQGRAAMRVASITYASAILNAVDFPVGVLLPPLPAVGETWNEWAKYRPSDYASSSESFSILKSSRNSTMAVEFMQFFASFVWNERFAQFASLLPAVAGARHPDILKNMGHVFFLGMSQSSGLSFRTALSRAVSSDYTEERWRYLSGEIDYKTFSANLKKKWLAPRGGIYQLWRDAWQQDVRGTRAAETAFDTAVAKSLFFGGDHADGQMGLARELMFKTLEMNGGANQVMAHDRLFKGSDNTPIFPGRR